MDLLDRQIAHALRLDGRASFSRIAAVLGVSDQTVARRYRALRQAGTVKVVGGLSAGRIGLTTWVIRLQCAPGSSAAIARALAKRADTSWVRIASGGTEVLCSILTPDDDREALLLERLPATKPIIAISTYCVVHTFTGNEDGWQPVATALNAEQIAALAPDPPANPPADPPADPRPESAIALDPADRILAAELARDGRTPFTELAAATGLDESSVRRRLAALQADGTLYFDLDVDSRAFGYGFSALLWLSVEPARLSAVGQALAGFAEVAFAGATTGPTDVLASVVTTSGAAFYLFLTEAIGALPGVREIQSAPVLRTVKRAGA
ncbi:Lrp/AsnC family transcriptional regulator [Catenulispora sp. NF23]|uniref:Lrp/AsnC family transcriptional regulator n=1 Tax=Catenulispora pinistramenti TaxID=2705254 RepID=A0ABS5KMR5_9ACTN|nr:Lrp/AsnC family transcriptional regulator [Catenulispora pinistramenti]MBS2531419.1 Lrp/AsnC family transcriptional regulator [Catenulispora pinistramenti]MBS2547351.1 Lrp/AsnC family transcriptional regulator [Catenulispora pinistramenti]